MSTGTVTAAGTVIWPSPNGVDHLVILNPGAVPGIASGKCVTCGRTHNVGHAVTASRLAHTYRPELRIPCVTEITDWPYECRAKDLNPGATVYRCTVHGIWWYETT